MQAFRILYRSNLTISEALARIEKELERIPEIEHLVDFYLNSKRGVSRGHKDLRHGVDDDLGDAVEI